VNWPPLRSDRDRRIPDWLPHEADQLIRTIDGPNPQRKPIYQEEQ
jgi:hypothetical protein